MARVTLDSRVRVPIADLTGEQADAIRAACTHGNPNYGKPRHEGEPQSYRTWSHDDAGNLTVPRGAHARVLKVLGLDVEVDDRRTWRHPEPGFGDHLKKARDYQEEQIRAGLEADEGLLIAPTGSGKTTSAFGLLSRLKRRSLVSLGSTALLKQWRDRAGEELGMREEEVGHIQGDREIVRPLTLASQKTLYNRFSAGPSALADAFDVFVLDEAQHAPADTFMGAIDPIRARKRYGFSADYTRHDQLEFFTRDVFGPVISRIAEERLIESGAVVEVEMNVVPTKFEAPPWYRFRPDFNKLLDLMVEDDDRNALILSLIRSAVSAGEQVIVFTHRVEHARLLDSRVASLGIPGGLMLGGVEQAEEFDRTKAKLKAGVLRVAVGTYKAIGEGIDVPAVARGICTTPIHKQRQHLGQVKGRVCRPADGKERGKLAYLADPVYGRRPVENFVDWFREVRVWDARERKWVSGREWLARLRR